jgi:hypothetical protein
MMFTIFFTGPSGRAACVGQVHDSAGDNAIAVDVVTAMATRRAKFVSSYSRAAGVATAGFCPPQANCLQQQMLARTMS